MSPSALFFRSASSFFFLSLALFDSASAIIRWISCSVRPEEATMRMDCCFPVASQHAAPDGRAGGDHFVGIDALVRFLGEELLHDLLHQRHARHAADEDDAVDVARLHAAVLESELAGLDRLLHEIVDERLEL